MQLKLLITTHAQYKK